MKRFLSYKGIFMILVITGILCLCLTACKEEAADQIPVLITIQAADADITSTTAKLKGEIISLGNQKIAEYGIEISKSQLFSSPVRNHLNPPAVTGQFEVDFTGLDPDTRYYYRAYTVINTAHKYSPDYLNFITKSLVK
jgi:hypothetical protein